VKGDRNVSYEKVVEAMVILQRAGAKRLGLLTQPPEEPRRKR
jgi:biopolymer transport protein TolR